MAEAIPIGRVQGSGMDRLHRGKRCGLAKDRAGNFQREMVWHICTAVMRVLCVCTAAAAAALLCVRDSACHLAVGYFAARAEASSHWERQARSTEGLCRKVK
jgi:hypothetical protein